jgi:hypothetical protein
MYHYVYKLEHIETGEFYIGSRSSKRHPTLDNYLGSMKIWKPDKTKLRKIILKSDFSYRESAILFESEEILNNIENSLNRNYHIPSKGFHTNGMVTVRDKNGQTFKVSITDERYLSGELVHNFTGFTNAIDKDGNIFHISTKDPRYLSGELTSLFKGKTAVMDKSGNIFHISTKDPKYLGGEFISLSKNKIVVKDLNGDFIQVNINDPRYLNGELKPIWLGRKHSPETKEKIGRKNSIKQRGKKNSQYGKCWINNNRENKKIKKEELEDWLNIGWIKGRKMKFKN